MDDKTQRYLVEEELENYRDGWISRREFIRRAGFLGIGLGIASAMATTVIPARPGQAAPLVQGVSPFTVPENDPSVATDWVQYRSSDGVMVKAYAAWPAGAAMDQSHPGVAICFENEGLSSHIRDVARRFAKQGYVAVAPDLLSRVGPSTEELGDMAAIRTAYMQLDGDQNARDLVAAVEFLQAHPAVDESKLAANGYCFGGDVTWRVTTMAPQLRAAAPFYGGNPPLDEVPNIRAAVFGVYGGLDDRVNAGMPALESALQAAGTTYAFKVYPNSQHAFHRDTDPRYNPETAPVAWVDTLNWFAQQMGLPAPVI